MKHCNLFFLAILLLGHLSLLSQSLYNYNGVGEMHNEFLVEYFDWADFSMNEEELLSSIDEFMETKNLPFYSEILTSNNLNINSEAYVMVNRFVSSYNLKMKLKSVVDTLYSFDKLHDNQFYQNLVMEFVAQSDGLSDEDRVRYLTAMDVLSHSIYFWLTQDLAGMDGFLNIVRHEIRYISGKQSVTDHDMLTDIRSLLVRSWLTNFADVFSCDMVSGLGAAWTANPAIVAGVSAGGSAVRGVTLFWSQYP